MPEQALYLKWRPLSFNDVVGQEHITRTLRNSLKTGRIRHAYLFSGPRGTGKTTTARLLAKAVNCTNEDSDLRPCNECPQCIAVNEGRYLDLIEIDAATHTGVDDVRDLREKIAFTPGEGRYKVYIIDEVHRFSASAFDALLKTLEEPPDHAIFVLATTEIDKVPATIKSRCLQFEFRRVSLVEVADRLQMIADAEGLNIERGALELIAREGTGSVRDSISLLDQIVSDPDEVISLEVAQRILGTASTRAVKELAQALVDENIPRGLHVINTAIDAGSDPRQFGQQVVEHLRNILLTQTAGPDIVEASQEDHQLFVEQARNIERPTLLRAVRAFNDATGYRSGWQPQLALELALIESVYGAQDAPIVSQQMVQQMVQQAAQASGTQPQPQPEAPRVDAEPDKPPVIPLPVVQEKWDDTLRVLHRINEQAPAVVQYFRPVRVDGNVVHLATDNDTFFKRMYNHRQRLSVVEEALRRIHKVDLRVDVRLMDRLDNETTAPPPADRAAAADPLIQEVIELGGRLKQDGDNRPTEE